MSEKNRDFIIIQEKLKSSEHSKNELTNEINVLKTSHQTEIRSLRSNHEKDIDDYKQTLKERNQELAANNYFEEYSWLNKVLNEGYDIKNIKASNFEIRYTNLFKVVDYVYKITENNKNTNIVSKEEIGKLEIQEEHDFSGLFTLNTVDNYYYFDRSKIRKIHHLLLTKFIR